MDYVIRPVETLSDHRQAVALQQRIWEGEQPVPTHLTLALARHGGVVLGAFLPDGHMIGLVMSFLGWSRFGLCHHSHMAAVSPEWQGCGIGTALKHAQRRAVLAQGVTLITWTYDPLLARNAWFNIGKLRAICRTYIRNAYGDMPDPINAGVPSDRFEVEWWLDRDLRGPKPTLSIDIPHDFAALKRASTEAALAWRMRVREQCERAFAEGYAVVEFERTTAGGRYWLAKLDP